MLQRLNDLNNWKGKPMTDDAKMISLVIVCMTILLILLAVMDFSADLYKAKLLAEAMNAQDLACAFLKS